MKKQKRKNRGGQRRMTTSTCPNLLLSLRAFLSPCDGQSWWCPVSERERERGQVTVRVASVMTGLPPFFVFISLCFFILSSSVSLSLFASSFPIVLPRTSADSKVCPGATESLAPVLLQSPMSSPFFLCFFFFPDINNKTH